MPLHLEDFIDLIAEICEKRALRVAVTESLKGGLLTGLSALAGGILLGPIGLAIGGAIGGGASALSAHGKFKSVAVVLLNLTPAQKNKLYDKFLYAFREFDARDAISIMLLLKARAPMQEMAIDLVKKFLSSEMGLEVMAP